MRAEPAWRRRHALSWPGTALLPFKLSHDRRHYVPRQGRKAVNWRDYDAGLRQRGSLTVRPRPARPRGASPPLSRETA